MPAPTSPPEPAHLRYLQLPDVLAVSVSGIALVVALGWVFNLKPLQTFSGFEFYPPMPMVNAIGLIILGIALFAVQRLLGQMIALSAITATLLSLGGLYESAGNTNLGLTTLFTQNGGGDSSLLAAISFGFAAALLGLSLKPSLQSGKVFTALTLGMMFLPFSALTGYMSNAQTLTQTPLYKHFSLPEALAFSLLAIGLAAATNNPLKDALKAMRVQRRWAVAIPVMVAVAGAIMTAQLSLHSAWGFTAALAIFSSAVVMSSVVTSYLLAQQEQAPAPEVAKGEPLTPTGLQQHLLNFVARTGDAILMVDNTGTINFANASASKIFGWPQDELIHQNVNNLIPKRFRASHLKHFQRFFQSAAQDVPYTKRGELIGLTQQGYEKALAIALFKCPPGHLAIATISELTGVERDLAQRVMKNQLDSVTGIPNRDDFKNFCENHWAQIIRKSENCYCILVIDLDSLKNINNKYGREFGDNILQTVATAIKHRLRTGDKLFRYSSDEFVLVCNEMDEPAAELLAERIRTSIKVTPTRLGENNIYVTCSIGLSLCEKLPTDLAATVDRIIESLNFRESDQKDQVVTVRPLL